MVGGNDPFKRVIEKLNALDAVEFTKIPVRDLDKEYIGGLIEKYNLPPDDTSKEVLIRLRRRIPQVGKREFPKPLVTYLKAFLRDIMENSEEVYSAIYLAFLCGIIFEDIVEIQEDSE